MNITAGFLPLGSELLKGAADQDGKDEGMIRFGRQKAKSFSLGIAKDRIRKVNSEMSKMRRR